MTEDHLCSEDGKSVDLLIPVPGWIGRDGVPNQRGENRVQRCRVIVKV